MYSLNGVPFDNPSMDWWLVRPMKTLSDIVRQVQSVRYPGRDGVLKDIDAATDPIEYMVRCQMPRARTDAFLALVSAPDRVLSLTQTPERVAEVELLSTQSSGELPGDELVTIGVLFRIPEVWWRDAQDTTSPAVPVNSSSIEVEVLHGLSQPVRDAVIRVKGLCTGLRVTDSSGGWVKYDDEVPTGSYWRFEPAKRKAFLTSTDTWSGGTEVTGATDWSGRAYPFSITPSFTDPTARVGKLTVTTTTRVGAQIQVRGRRAFAIA